MNISFDYDQCLSKSKVEAYAKKLIDLGFELYIVTYRNDDNHKTNYPLRTISFNGRTFETENFDVYERAGRLGIPYKNIIFTNATDKYHYFKANPDFIFHLDDTEYQIDNINRHSDVRGVLYMDGGTWELQCELLIDKYNGQS